MADVTARDIMTPDPVTIAPEAGVTEAARLMTDRSVGALPVIDAAGRLIGLVTEGDLIMQDVKLEYPTYIQLLDGFIMYPPAHARFEHELKKAVAATVKDVMSEDPITVTVDTSIEDVATLLADERVSRLPVLDGGRLVGIVSKRDIVKAIAGGLS
ncbi:MAG: CBS domain-containing protein [Coriobacteriia bacterium]|nr:CBS domain-containing protein [Coriobacteriia bacterium]